MYSILVLALLADLMRLLSSRSLGAHNGCEYRVRIAIAPARPDVAESDMTPPAMIKVPKPEYVPRKRGKASATTTEEHRDTVPHHASLVQIQIQAIMAHACVRAHILCDSCLQHLAYLLQVAVLQLSSVLSQLRDCNLQAGCNHASFTSTLNTFRDLLGWPRNCRNFDMDVTAQCPNHRTLDSASSLIQRQRMSPTSLSKATRLRKC